MRKITTKMLGFCIATCMSLLQLLAQESEDPRFSSYKWQLGIKSTGEITFQQVEVVQSEIVEPGFENLLSKLVQKELQILPYQFADWKRIEEKYKTASSALWTGLQRTLDDSHRQILYDKFRAVSAECRGEFSDLLLPFQKSRLLQICARDQLRRDGLICFLTDHAEDFDFEIVKGEIGDLARDVRLVEDGFIQKVAEEWHRSCQIFDQIAVDNGRTDFLTRVKGFESLHWADVFTNVPLARDKENASDLGESLAMCDAWFELSVEGRWTRREQMLSKMRSLKFVIDNVGVDRDALSLNESQLVELNQLMERFDWEKRELRNLRNELLSRGDERPAEIYAEYNAKSESLDETCFQEVSEKILSVHQRKVLSNLYSSRTLATLGPAGLIPKDQDAAVDGSKTDGNRVFDSLEKEQGRLRDLIMTFENRQWQEQFDLLCESDRKKLKELVGDPPDYERPNITSFLCRRGKQAKKAKLKDD
ncbi:MAG: hypothetical protein ACK493_01355 [Planctomycetota bacterium]|jgi:hypothetical protein